MATHARTPNDSDILSFVAHHPAYGEVRYERVKQDRRTYYRFGGPRLSSGSLTTAKGARETIAYWKTKGWV